MAQRSGGASDKKGPIAEDLRARIAVGEYPVGAKLPTKDEMAAIYGAAKGTVDGALAILRGLKLIETLQGVGSFVLRDQPEESEEPEAQHLGEQVATLQAQMVELAERIGAAEDAGGQLQANLADLYGKVGFAYPEDGDDDTQRDRTVGHG